VHPGATESSWATHFTSRVWAAKTLPANFQAISKPKMKQAFDNIGAVLKAAGMAPTDVVRVQLYLTDGATFERMNVVYKAYFSNRPTRTTVASPHLWARVTSKSQLPPESSRRTSSSSNDLFSASLLILLVVLSIAGAIAYPC